MKTSRVAVFHAPNQPLTEETVAVPALRPGETLVRNEYTTLCRSDLNTFSGKRTERTPTILGHEIVGRIEAFGPDAPTHDARGAALRVGDRVTWAIYAADPDSALARRGMPQKGPDLFKYGHEPITPEHHLHGGLSEYCVLRRHTPLVRLATTVPLPVGALINCAVATVAGSLRLAGDIQGRNLLVAGAGMLGVVACAMARVGGARKVIALDPRADRLENARRFGADAGIAWGEVASGALRQAAARSLGAGQDVEVGLDYSGVPETMESVLETLGVGGTLVLVGATFPQRPLQVDAEQMVRRLLTVKGLHNYNREDLVAAVDFIERRHGEFPFLELVEDRFDLATVNAAFQHGLNSEAYRVGVRCQPR